MLNFEDVLKDDVDRETLIQLKEDIKQALSDGVKRENVVGSLKEKYELFFSLLSHQDPKVRKNTAQILGLLADSCFLNPLWEAYQKEEMNFVRNSYLETIQQLEYSKIFKELLKRKEELLLQPITQENKKHLTQEIRLLESFTLIPEKHLFTGWKVSSELFLVTEKEYAVYTITQLKEQGIIGKEWNLGVLVKTEKIREVISNRTFREVLFLVSGMKKLSNDTQKAAKEIAKSKLLDFLKERHNTTTPFYFRLEIRSRSTKEEKSKFAKRLAIEIEYQTKRQLLNSTSHYEIEIRLIENKEGTYTTLVKLMTLPDLRFSYRKNVVAASIRPNVAALIMYLASDYLTPNAKVLDPFCGVGTMLIERGNWGKTNAIYGVDTFGEAILGARENTKTTGLTIYYIHRDFFSFQHEMMFDELITNLPFTKNKEEEIEIKKLYEKFFKKALQHMKKQGILVLYTHNIEFVKCHIKNNYRIEKIIEISKKEETHLCILRIQSEIYR